MTLQKLCFTPVFLWLYPKCIHIWYLALLYPSPSSPSRYVSERKPGLRATELSDSISGLLTPMTVLETKREEEIKVLIPLLLITDSCVPHFTCPPRFLMEEWHNSRGRSLLCSPLAGWELKPPLHFLQILSPDFSFDFGRQRRPRF